jgi:uncharacterized protein YggE
MYQEQLIQTPFGISVFGSSLIRVEPDIVTLNFVVSSLQKHPKDAFQDVRKAIHDVREYLDTARVDEIDTSRVSITQTFRYMSGVQEFIGYTAKVGFCVLLRQIDKMEDVLSGIVDAGVNEINSVDFQTTKLKEIRADARRQALVAAREKAENYCNAAGVYLGKVIHIEEVNPDDLGSKEGHVRGTSKEFQTFQPGNITISAAVIVAYKIEYQK